MDRSIRKHKDVIIALCRATLKSRRKFCMYAVVMFLILISVAKMRRPLPKKEDPRDVQARVLKEGVMKQLYRWTDMNRQQEIMRRESVHVDDTAAQKLHKEVRILVWVMTSPENLMYKARAVRETWGKRANKLIFFSSKTNASFPTIGLNVPEGRQHLTAKTMNGFKYVYKNHLDDADWFMKVDDDTYVIMENLRHFLSAQNPEQPVFFGRLLSLNVTQGYYSGGGGYVLSKEALRRFGRGADDPKICRPDGGDEDMQMGYCLERLGVKTANSTDPLGRSRFNIFKTETHLLNTLDSWYFKYNAEGSETGIAGFSDQTITFHYVEPHTMMLFDLLLYHIRPYGIKPLNVKMESNLNPNALLNRTLKPPTAKEKPTKT